uniref:Uncharacterized protein n=1 Tax=Triticum urartu TaxID=4572 RepID=A0A8R7TH67_TRIUA
MNYQRRLCSTSFLSDDCGGHGNKDDGAGAGGMTPEARYTPLSRTSSAPPFSLDAVATRGQIGQCKGTARARRRQ